MTSKQLPIPVERIEKAILLVRGHKVILDMDLAELYGVETRILNQAVKRNSDRFPEDFIFQLTAAEADWLVSQNVIPHKKYLGGALNAGSGSRYPMGPAGQHFED